MTHDLPPRVRDLVRGGHHSYIDEWQRRDDGWWAHLWWIEDNPKSGWSKHKDPFLQCDAWRPAAMVQRIDGEIYRKVRRTRLDSSTGTPVPINPLDT
ncbi:hypothetical protein GCM10023194_56730 [Planotetraspora phitsanulokensis]|uniref:Uncharacterized protein n=1 Tax=Planotetraspora phitsanulokensis TaxID=575192 RepID=A0A8J3UE01_9ACTN|nr:hypothetical protein [Planotetraspora phitsanulokensis]GII43030.1 hypothetical protein Pph01_80330 [Planotetraspora phitsanulokensis]